MKRIVLCADDYGQAPETSAGILDLIACGRLSAVSCMVTEPNWPEAALKLLSWQNKVSIGLHVNLTHGGNFTSLFKLLAKATCRQLDQSNIEAICLLQLDQFSKVLGRLPDFIDGHQHIQHLPIIRDALISACQKRYQGNMPYFRLAETGLKAADLKSFLKQLVIKFSGVKALKQRLLMLKIPHNTSFSGVYSLKPDMKYYQYFQWFIKNTRDFGMIMCHPGQPSSDVLDPIKAVRVNEYHYFMSDQFLLDCKAGQIEIIKVNGLKV